MKIKRIKNNWWKTNFFEAGMSNILYGTKKIRPAKDEVEWMVKVAGIKPHSKILDVGCGVGKHTVAFAKKGFDVLGIDISKNFLKKAGDLAKQEKAMVTLKNLPMHRLRSKEEFDLLVNLFTSFGYYSPRSRNIDIFKRMVRALKYNGTIIFDATYREAIEKNFQPKNWRIINNTFLLEKRYYSKKDKQIYNDWLYIDNSKRKHYRFKLHLFSKKELKDLFYDSGLRIIGYYGSLTGSPLTKNSAHIVIIARKCH